MSAAVQLAPTRVGKFELLLPIGTGGMATVFLARAPVLAGVYRDVAVKLMHPHLGADGIDGAAMLLHEAEIAALVRHPNVVAVEEAAVDPAGVYLVMPYVEGDSLSGLLRAELARGSTMPRRIAARILCDALSGLHAAHELCDDEGHPRSVVHRDFTPSNIIVGVDGMSRLTDFGIAKTASRIARTTTGQVKGKVGYMSPEQVRALPLDRRADVWAAGVVAWECLAGQRLFGGDDVGVMLRIAQDVPPRLRSVRPDIPHPIDSAIAAALEPVIETRCATAEELRQRLATAFELDSGIADVAEVAAYVRRLAGPALAERRERAGALRGRRTEPAVSSNAGQGATAGSQTARLDHATTATRPRVPQARRSSRVVVASLVVAGAAAAVTFAALVRSPPTAATAATEVDDPTAESSAPTASAAPSSATSAAPPHAAASAAAPSASLSGPEVVARPAVRAAPRTAPTSSASKGTQKGPKLGDYPGR